MADQEREIDWNTARSIVAGVDGLEVQTLGDPAPVRVAFRTGPFVRFGGLFRFGAVFPFLQLYPGVAVRPYVLPQSLPVLPRLLVTRAIFVLPPGNSYAPPITLWSQERRWVYGGVQAEVETVRDLWAIGRQMADMPGSEYVGWIVRAHSFWDHEGIWTDDGAGIKSTVGVWPPVYG